MAEEETPVEESSGGKKKLILLVVIGLLLVGISVGGTLFALKMMGGESAPSADGETEEAAPEVKLPAVYFPLKPPILANFNVKGRQRFLQADITLKLREPDAVAAVELHMPMIRNALVMIISGQIYEELQTPEGRELLRQQALAEIQSILETEIGKPGVEQVLFTNFVMQ
ncbi:flagellar basal body-associated FliL family protein [Simiduia agarivorans]|uniref:Flagellar protein FliL n=1 Tax=Simiduia agarivorans (strain DSM 21679 / JCM 13881 / BCRC 17597 / SA1) TaxID=1117647 RepID=K4KF76_SIMAS|nr:flagellar basal body-associated FliL family protein [Simiduia agarivorans]AFU97694.1 flagellar basal body-associated protein FliL [Simiduia agarivorans SA1 = DSM 21679]